MLLFVLLLNLSLNGSVSELVYVKALSFSFEELALELNPKILEEKMWITNEV